VLTIHDDNFSIAGAENWQLFRVKWVERTVKSQFTVWHIAVQMLCMHVVHKDCCLCWLIELHHMLSELLAVLGVTYSQIHSPTHRFVA